MPSISVKELFFWKKKQLSKGGDYQSFSLLLDAVGGISNHDLNLSRLDSKENLYLTYPNNYNHFVKYFRDTYQHGGISMEEMICPFVRLSPK